MEMIVASAHTVFTMEDLTRVGQARRHAAGEAAKAGLGEVEAGKLAIVVTELGTNLVRHARRGRLLVSTRAARGEIELVAIDEGPGIPDLARSMGDGFSTGGTPGTGLGAVGRLADEFDMHSSVPAGTVVVARVRAAGSAARTLNVAAISIAAPGETECGDSWAFGLEGDSVAVLVADGLGHGPDAAVASREAVEEFSLRAGQGPAQVLQALHLRLRGTRGAAVGVLRADGRAGVLTLSGAGNVTTRIISGATDRTLLTQSGTAGLHVRSPHQATADWPAHALVVMFSDGVESRWPGELLHDVLQRDPAIAAAILLRDHLRGKDDATVAVVRRSST
jgi:anti-sigma regulatory factor (Ser/Thr protein kinase)